jgi:hypothetical protein
MRNQGILVDFIGQAGGGKSTLLPLVVSELRQITAGYTCSLGNKPNYMPLGFILTIISHPHLLLRARAISEIMRKKYGYIFWIKRFAYHTWHKSGLFYSSPRGIWLFDEGVVHYLAMVSNKPLSMGGNPLTVDLLSRCPLPHIVVEIRVEWIQSAWRRVMRSKSVPVSKMVRGNERKLQAKRLADRFMQERDQIETLDFLKKWSNKYCDPALNDIELGEIILAAVREAGKKDVMEICEEHWLRPALESLGVLWICVDTSDGNSPQDVSKVVAERIWNYCQSRSF